MLLKYELTEAYKEHEPESAIDLSEGDVTAIRKMGVCVDAQNGDFRIDRYKLSDRAVAGAMLGSEVRAANYHMLNMSDYKCEDINKNLEGRKPHQVFTFKFHGLNREKHKKVNTELIVNCKGEKCLLAGKHVMEWPGPECEYILCNVGALQVLVKVMDDDFQKYVCAQGSRSKFKNQPRGTLAFARRVMWVEPGNHSKGMIACFHIVATTVM